MITDYYQQSIRALQLTGMSERTQEYNNVLHIFIFYIIQPIESENMMDMPDYSVEVIIAIFLICKCDVPQHCQTIASPGLIEPLKPSPPVLRKLEEKFPLMTSVGDMPDVSRNIVSFCSCHGFPFILLFLTTKTTI
jgi:hypothetical protein